MCTLVVMCECSPGAYRLGCCEAQRGACADTAGAAMALAARPERAAARHQAHNNKSSHVLCMPVGLSTAC